MATNDAPHTPKSLRARLALSQDGLAERCGDLGHDVSVRTIQRLEDGGDVSLDSLRAIATGLGVEPQALIEAIDVERARKAEGSAA